ncbi:MAG: bifunctional adenosylcobinamide kinase/adenosylcobinamide-phosphate guanylyltransferase [Treponema sp.]|jgi:adenosylcobinamide kinase/adenosylcobinamide-phosphate guanylyltransferase|nr:bifunctional adenosylcobinamide kinase/adenosylcobinamide-phosphate guanylyltransferase [Treponema sp.]
MIIFITGGIKSGKSRRALDLAIAEWKPSARNPVSFIATAEALDDEMKSRIMRHREERGRLAGEGALALIEETLELDRALAAAGGRALVDCIPMWVNNLMYYKREEDFPRILDSFIAGMKSCIIVSNETGLGNVPFDEDTRRYNLLLAGANRKIAAAADRVELMVAGIPLRVK